MYRIQKTKWPLSVFLFGWVIVLCGLIPSLTSAEVLYPAQKVLELNDKSLLYEINEAVRVLEDSSNGLTLNDVVKPSWKNKFKPAKKGPLNLGYSDSSFWIKLPMRYTGSRDSVEWWYQLDLPLLEYSAFHLVVGEPDSPTRIINKSMHYDLPLNDRDVNHVTQVYRFSLNKGEQATLYVKIKNDFSIHLPLSIYTPEGFTDHVAVEELLYGAFIGAILIMTAYNLFMFISVRERSFLFYILYMASYLVFLMTERVHGLSLFGDIPDVFHKKYLAFYIWASWFFALLMARSFLDTKEKEPGLDFVIKMFIGIVVISMTITAYTDLTTGIQWAVFCTLLYAILMAWIAYTVMMRGNAAARFYFVAWILNFGGVAIYALTVTGYIPYNFITGNSPHLGIVCQLVLISFALGDRLKVAQRDAVLANRQALDNMKRYRALFDNAVEGIFQISLNRRFIDVNPAMASMLGYSSPQKMIKNVRDAISICYPREEDFNTVVSAIEEGHEVYEMTARYNGRNGQECWATSTVRVIYNHKSIPQHLEGTFVDITERIERERVERGSEQARLETEVAEASAAAKSQFLANMSHEIRTPLTAIIGYGESLLDETLSDEERQESSEVVVRSGKHLLQLINDILDHSKIDADKLDTEVMNVNLLTLLSEIKTYFDAKAAEKNISFNLKYDFPLPSEIQTDPTRLKQILINLCSNALKFTDQGSVSLMVRCEPIAEKLYINVLDTGIGVKQEQLEKLFDPFAQASPSVARQYGGTGLGLSISRRLAEMLGGTISASSVYGEGSQFEVTIATGPLKNVRFVRDRSELHNQRTKLEVTTTPCLQGEVLYAEDNEVNRRLIKQLVSRTGASLTLVTNGAEALEAGTRNGQCFDLILMDIQMPVMDGRDATKALREAGINTPIIALTANVMAEDIAEYKEAGCNEVMAKPVEKSPFYKMLSRYLEHSDEAETSPLDIPDKAAMSKMQPLSGRVLLAEDNADNCLLMTRYLTKLGVTIIIAENGREAVSKAMKETVDVILMDQHMPEMSGPEAVALLRQTGFNRPILAFTASDEADELLQMKNAGCNGVVEKPVKIANLYQMLSQYLPIASAVNAASPDEHPWQDPDLRPIVEHFVKGVPQRVEAMIAAFSQKNWDELRSQSHQIKGTAGSLGFPELTERASRLETAIKQGENENIQGLFDALVEEATLSITKFS
ncbi:response regulator [Alkalimarinus alittae]|uniref:histidine kinase n=1 Tax=Alkalimarinus alittae TaxID=2961619 RepID=A0ABY6N1V6_9ALTE|nr:response regulator [Alkalimarinus alittae]UZE96101.1 response regulator [Alkalimarinus alittae]